MKTFLPFRFASAALAFALALAALRATAAVTLSDTYAPHFAGNTVRIAVAADAVGSPFYEVNSGYDVYGNYYTWGSAGLFAIAGSVRDSATNQSLAERFLELDGHPDDFNGPLDFEVFLAPGAYRVDVSLEAANYEDGHWYDDAFLDENGNWVSNGAAWTDGSTWSAGQFGAGGLLQITVTSGGTTPQTITWTSPPPAVWVWNDTVPRTLVAVSSAGLPVTFVIVGAAPGSPGYNSYASAFSLAGNQLSIGGTGWGVGQSVTIRARAPGSIAYAEAYSDWTISISKAQQGTIALNASNMLNPYGSQSLLASGGSTYPPVFQIIGGAGSISGSAYLPNGYCGDVTVRVYYPENPYYFASGYATKSFWVASMPSIISPPASQTVLIDGTAIFTVTTSGGPAPVFTWRKDGVPVVGQASATLVLEGVQASDAGAYTVVATNQAGSVTSADAILTVIGPMPEFTAHPQDRAVPVGGTATLSGAAATGSGLPIAYRWRKNGVDISGGTTATLMLANVQTGDAGSYTLVATCNGASALSEPAVLTVIVPPTIAIQPSSRLAGPAFVFSVTVNGSAPLTYQWYLDGTAIPGANVATYQRSNAVAADLGTYTVTVSNAAGSVTSVPATLGMVAPGAGAQITAQPASVTTTLGQSVSFSVGVGGMLPWSIQWRKNGAALAGQTGTWLYLTNLTAADVGVYDVTVANEFGAAVSAPATLTIVGVAPPDVPLHITQQPQTQTAGAGSTVQFKAVAYGTITPILYVWRKNGVNLDETVLSTLPSITSTLTLHNVQAADAGDYNVYTFAAANNNGAVESQPVQVILTSAPPTAPAGIAPVIVTPPQEAAVPAGQAAEFTVAALSATPLFYQWLRNGTAIEGATSATLTLSNVGYHQNGARYSVVVSNGSGATTSAEAQLLVLGPVISVSQRSDTAFRLTWLAEAGTSHRIVVKSGATTIMDTSNAPQPFPVTGLTPGSTYSAQVHASDANGTVFRSVPLLITTRPVTYPMRLATETAHAVVQPSAWLDVWQWQRSPTTGALQKVTDGVLDEVLLADEPERNSAISITGVTQTYNYTVLGTSVFSPFTLHWDIEPIDFFGPSLITEQTAPDGSYDGPVGLNEADSNVVYFIHVETYYTGHAEFEMELGYDYAVYSMDDGAHVNTPGQWRREGMAMPVVGTSRGRVELWDIRPPSERWYRLVRQSFTTGGCILALPGMGSVTAGKLGTLTLPGNIKVTAGTGTASATATINFPTGVGSATATATVNSSGVVISGSLPANIGVANGQGGITLTGGITVTVANGEVTVTGMAGAAITAIGSPAAGSPNIRLTLPQGAPNVLGQIVDLVGGVFGGGSNPNKPVVQVGNGGWGAPSTVNLGGLGVGTHTVGVGVTAADGQAPRPENTFTIQLTVVTSLPAMIKNVANGDVSTLPWSGATEQALAQPIYAGDTNGDMVSWSLNDLLPGTYSWSATGPYFDAAVTLPTTIQGPSGANLREWRIARANSNGSQTLLDWMPGTYYVRCHVTRGWGDSFDVGYQQRIGWRSARYLVVGQVRPISDFAITSGQQAALRSDLIADVQYLTTVMVAPVSSVAAAAIVAYVNLSPLQEVAQVWFALNSVPPKRVAPLPNVGENERFWLVQTMLNDNPDSVELSTANPLDGQPLLNLFQFQSFRMLGEYQVKYLLAADRKTQGDSVATVGSPTSLSGPTKMRMPGLISALNSTGVLWVLVQLGLQHDGTNLLIPPMDNYPNHGKQSKDINGGRLSLYTSARIGWEASYGNYALFERDVPYIFNEIILGSDDDGRDRQNKIRLSINKTWNWDGTETGLIYFNEIRIYQRINGSASYDRLITYPLDLAAGMLRPFIFHVPLQQFPTVPPVPQVQDIP